jgi:hypothetical protein
LKIQLLEIDRFTLITVILPSVNGNIVILWEDVEGTEPSGHVRKLDSLIDFKVHPSSADLISVQTKRI